MKESILHLTLKRSPFDVMVTGEKDCEYRKPSDWIMSRLKKNYDFVIFKNGYAKDAPYFKCVYEGYLITEYDSIKTYSNGLEVEVKKGDIVILLGKVVEHKVL